ncbi:MAG: AraC family transcriptional regulator [Oscillospiraceae bacterium]|nr:AraC family transcriptional regulator [Oscillospiraceae bacterium]
MFVNAAYLNNSTLAIEDESKPLIVTSCGNYKVKNRAEVRTSRPKGRKDYQLLYIAAGQGHFFVNGQERVVSAGNIIVYLPGQPQEYVYFKDDKTDVYWVHFTGNDVERIIDYYNIRLSENIIYIGTSPDYQWLFGQIIQEMQLCRPRFEELISLLLRNIFILISRNLIGANRADNSLENEVELAMHYFRENYRSEVNVEDYALSRGMSASNFYRVFKQISGSTPLQFILKLRLSNAQNLLENSNLTIAEIASAVGYENPLYFSRLFHKHIGVSPFEYRKMRT